MRLVSGSFGGWVATIPFIFLFYFFYDIAYTPLVVAYVVEILPFNIRSRGFAVMVSEESLLTSSVRSMCWSVSSVELDSVSRARV